MKTLQKTNLLFALLLIVPMALTARSSKVIKEKINLKDFSAISISGGWNAVLTQGNLFSVTVEADDESFEKLHIEVQNSILYVSNNERKQYIRIFNRKRTVRNVYITMPKLEKIIASGGCNILPKTSFYTDNMTIVMSGGSELENLLLDCESLDCNLSGGTDVAIQLINSEEITIRSSGGSDLFLSGIAATAVSLNVSGGSDAELQGKTTRLKLVASGACDVEAFGLKAENCTATVSGSADANLCVTELLDITATGASDVSCKGNPKEVRKTVGRSSSLRLR